jgi:hypothetical protein
MGDNSDALEYWHPTDPVNLAFDLNQSIITNALSLNASLYCNSRRPLLFKL